MKKAEIRRENGSPAVYVDDERRVPMALGLSDIPGSATNTAYAQKNIAAFGRTGMHMVMVDVEMRAGWHKVSPFEWEPMQEEIAAAQQADPEAAILVRFHLNPPYWWLRDHPEECIVYEDGTRGTDDGETLRLIRDDAAQRLRVSLASEKWREEAGENLRLFCENVWDTPEGRGVLGIQVACGIYGEWHQWGADQSEPMRRYFRSLLKERYADDAALREAWGDPSVTLETAPFCSDPAQPGTDGIFRDPVLQRKIMDAQYATQRIVPEDILYFCRIVKESWGRPVLAGSFYGYYIKTGGSNAPIGGHLLPEVLFAQREYVDFLSGPFPYYKENRSPAGVPLQRGLLESDRLNGMLWLTEMDENPAGLEHVFGGDPARMDETVAQMRRCVLQPMLSGQGMWYYDHRLVPGLIPPDSTNPYAGSLFRKVGWWDKPELMKEVEWMYRLSRKYMMGAYTPAADVLVVFHARSHFATARFVNEEYSLMEAVMRSGAVCDTIYLSDLDKAEMDRYRCVIFPNAYNLTAGERKIIREKTAGRPVLFLYAAGISDEKTLRTENISELTGIRVVRTGPEKAYRKPTGQEYAIDPCDYAPFLAVEDPEAENLGVYVESGACAVARKGNIWYSASPRIDRETVLELFRAAGVHRYTDSGDPVLAGNGLVLINSYNGGTQNLVLKNGKRLKFAMPPRSTWIFDAETGERLESED